MSQMDTYSPPVQPVIHSNAIAFPAEPPEVGLFVLLGQLEKDYLTTLSPRIKYTKMVTTIFSLEFSVGKQTVPVYGFRRGGLKLAPKIVSIHLSMNLG